MTQQIREKIQFWIDHKMGYTPSKPTVDWIAYEVSQGLGLSDSEYEQLEQQVQGELESEWFEEIWEDIQYDYHEHLAEQRDPTGYRGLKDSDFMQIRTNF